MRAAAAGSKVQNRKSTRGERGGVEKEELRSRTSRKSRQTNHHSEGKLLLK
jgi:hypothetical protein